MAKCKSQDRQLQDYPCGFAKNQCTKRSPKSNWAVLCRKSNKSSVGNPLNLYLYLFLSIMAIIRTLRENFRKGHEGTGYLTVCMVKVDGPEK